jgi:hypothetical protein
MNEIDQDIERVLAGLKAVEAPEGLDRRILLVAQERVSERASFVWLRPVGAFALTGAVVALALVATHRKGQAPVAIVRKPVTSSARATVPAQVVALHLPVTPLAAKPRTITAASAQPLAAEPMSLEMSEMLAPEIEQAPVEPLKIEPAESKQPNVEQPENGDQQ